MEEFNKKIIHLKGFDAIYGKMLFLGTCVGYNSMVRGFYYMDAGNKFWELLDKVCNTDFFLKYKREYLNHLNNEKEKEIIRNNIKNELNKHEIGISDIMEECDNTTNSSDNGIIQESIVYNHELPDLIDNADIIILNGQGRTADEFYKAIEMMKIDIKSKKIISVISSSGAANKYYKEREQMWKNIK